MKGAVGRTLRAARAEGSAPLVAERELLRTLAIGSRELLVRPFRWCRAGDGADKLWRAAGLAWAGAAAVWVVGQTPALLLVVIPAWAYTALSFAPAPPPNKIKKKAEGSEEQPDDDANETAEYAVEPPDDTEFVTAVADLIGDRNGVLLRSIVACFHQAGVGPSWGIPDVRAQCTALGITIRDTVNTREGSSSGVHRDDFRAALATLAEGPDGALYSPSPEVGPVPSLETGSASG
ncbi:hypothetical protein [Streptomyces sp. NPDC050428]|uniref:hypothetical protein n=1 Tax=Streptomyces sp. NPDC050428 TaxID=3155757 RepID=UPI00343260D7